MRNTGIGIQAGTVRAPAPESPAISVVIPSLSGNVSSLVSALRDQTRPPDEIEIVRGVRPNGRARNIGIARTTGDILVLIDDDAFPAQRDLIEKLAAPLRFESAVGATGASRLIPPGSSPFQRWTARQVARIENPVVHAPRDSIPSRENFFYSDITTTCCAVRREVFHKIGEFDPELIQGVDTEFFVRMGRAGYRLRLLPDLWVYHPAPATLGSLLRKHFRYGFGHAQLVVRDRSLARGPERRPLLYFILRTMAVVPHAFIPYSFGDPDWRPGFKPLKALASYASALGYTWGRIRHGHTKGGACRRS